MRLETLPQAESGNRRRLQQSGSALSRLHLLMAWGGPAVRASAAVSAVSMALMLFAGARGDAQTTPAQANPAQPNPAQAGQAQTTSPQTTLAPAPGAPQTPKHAHSHKKPAAVAPAPQPPPPPAPIAPPPPDWPANDQASAASVVFDSRGLMIVASNSSLAQILKDVSLDIGAKVEGMQADQRIFGTYGPGPARDVLRQLLDGSGYDVLMVGDRGEGTPRRIVLSTQSGTAAKNTANNSPPPPTTEDTDADQAPEPQAEPEPPPQPAQNGAAPPVPVRTPQQIMQEIEQRQQQQRSQGGQDNQQNPQN
jgi:outer membrane biosynthesis protein TonB